MTKGRRPPTFENAGEEFGWASLGEGGRARGYRDNSEDVARTRVGETLPEISHIDLASAEGSTIFPAIRSSLFSILQYAYKDYFGDEYHERRMLQDRSHIFVACGTLDSDFTFVAASYIKRNGRRAAIATHPNYRFLGVGRALVTTSLRVVPKQYSIVSEKNVAMIGLLKSVGFSVVGSVQELTAAASEEATRFENFRQSESGLVFDRKSASRGGSIKASVLCLISEGPRACQQR